MDPAMPQYLHGRPCKCRNPLPRCGASERAIQPGCLCWWKLDRGRSTAEAMFQALSLGQEDDCGWSGRMCEKFHQLLAVGRWFPPGTPVSSTRKLISSSFHRLDMTLAVAEALNPNKPKPYLVSELHAIYESESWFGSDVWRVYLSYPSQS